MTRVAACAFGFLIFTMPSRNSTFSQLFLTRFGLSMYGFACQTLGAQLRGQLVSGLLLSAILREGFRGILLLSKETLGALFF